MCVLVRVALIRVFCVPAHAMVNCTGQGTTSVELVLSRLCVRFGDPNRLSGLPRQCFADQVFFLAPDSPFLSSMYLFNEVFILKYPAFTRFAQNALLPSVPHLWLSLVFRELGFGGGGTTSSSHSVNYLPGFGE